MGPGRERVAAAVAHRRRPAPQLHRLSPARRLQALGDHAWPRSPSSLVILGTFITRSGIVQSVHAFQADPLSFWLSLRLHDHRAARRRRRRALWLRWETFEGNDEFESLTSKEAAYYFNNVLMLVAAVLVAYLTVTSALPSWLPFGGQSIRRRPPTTARAAGRHPVRRCIMAVCPILSWRKTDGADVLEARQVAARRRGRARRRRSLVEWCTSAAADLRSTPTRRRAQGHRRSRRCHLPRRGRSSACSSPRSPSRCRSTCSSTARASAPPAKGESFGTSLVNILTKARTQSGGYLTHLGIGIILIGLVGSAMYVAGRQADDRRASRARRSRSATTRSCFKGVDQQQLPNGDSRADRDLRRHEERHARSGTVTPGQTQFTRSRSRRGSTPTCSPSRSATSSWSSRASSGRRPGCRST